MAGKKGPAFLPDDTQYDGASRHAQGVGHDERASSLWLRRKLQPGMLGDLREILVGGQHCQVVADAQLRQKRVDRPDLHAFSAAVIPQLRRINVIVAIWYDKRQRRKALDDLGPALGPGEALQLFLQDE